MTLPLSSVEKLVVCKEIKRLSYVNISKLLIDIQDDV